jgi:hypothetical protein
MMMMMMMMMGRVCNACEKEVFTNYTFCNLKGRDVGAYGKIILKLK